VGRVWSEQELRELLALAERYQLTVISDEIHADLIYPEQRHIPLASLTDSVKVLTTIAPSKTFNIPGMGLSTLVIADEADRKAVNAVYDSWHVSAANPFSITAFEAAYRHGEPWLDALMVYLQQSMRWAAEFVETRLDNISLIEPEGTYLLWLDCREMELDKTALRQFFIEQAKVGMNPGYVFGEEGIGFMRLNMATPRSQLKQAFANIEAAMPMLSA
jgi:cystathionine beta-lyase